MNVSPDVILGLLLATFLVNFFVKSRIVIPAMGFFLCVAGIMVLSEGGMPNPSDDWFQWAFIVPAIFLAFQIMTGLIPDAD